YSAANKAGRRNKREGGTTDWRGEKRRWERSRIERSDRSTNEEKLRGGELKIGGGKKWKEETNRDKPNW
ncbi:hypothetical protein PFISCL1PPCAC_119, partial [Pristionchus fissidentatus]